MSGNKFGKALAWFCGDAAITLEENKEPSGDIWSEVDIYGETEDGRDCSSTVVVTELLSAASAEIESLQGIKKEMYEMLKECAHELELHNNTKLSEEINALLAKARGEAK